MLDPRADSVGVGGRRVSQVPSSWHRCKKQADAGTHVHASTPVFFLALCPLTFRPACSNVRTGVQGEIVNMQSNDTQRLMDLCPNFHLIWSAPLQIIGKAVF